MNHRPVISLVVLATSAFAGGTGAQDAIEVQPSPAVRIARLVAGPAIDGRVEVAEWAGATLLDRPFVQFEPEFGAVSPFRTLVRIGQTDKALYVAFEAFDPDVPSLSAARSQRDGRLSNDDSVAILLDTFADGRTAYLFRTNALAAQQDGRVADNGRTVELNWDAAWRCAAVRHADRWTAEFEIPFADLRFAADADGVWGVNFVRTVPRRLETAVWAGPSESVYRVSSFGELRGLYLQHQEDTLQFIPYLLASAEKGASAEFETGADLRWRPSSRLGVDLTANPDFALIEADVETINLSRFELSIPEKRPFFLEGNEMYEQRIRQFYSRRIGDITWGAKSSGKLGRTDFSAIATSEDVASAGGGQPADYGIVRLQHSLARGSNIGLLAANRDFQGDDAGSVGLDTTWFFTDALGLTAQLLRVHGRTADGGLAWFVRPAWDTARSHFHVRYTHLDAGIRDDFNAVGFLRDDDRKEFDTRASHVFWFDEGRMEKVEPSVNYNRYWSQAGELRSWELDAEVEIEFRSGWEIEIGRLEEFKLFEREFRNDRTTLEVGWDGRDGRSAWVFAGSGRNFDEDLELYGSGFRWSAGDRWRFSYELTRLELSPDREGESTTIHVFDALYAFHTDLFAKLFVQTNSVIDKENIQLLGVWRFRPPFGSLQLAYQSGTSERGQESQQDDTIFTKFSWVF